MTDTDPLLPRRKLSRLDVLGIVLCSIAGLILLAPVAGLGGGEHHGHDHAPPFWGIGIIPFVLILLCIAILPLIPATSHFWHSNRNKLVISVGLGLVAMAYLLLAQGWDSVVMAMIHAIPGEFVPFIILLFALYVISGGISIRGDLKAHPKTNTAIIAFGTLIASFIGTTGASMLLIRPLLQTNADRRHKVHTIVFFIFLVSNIGGSLLPIGDPPLFLGFLRGVPFTWTLGLWAPWLLTSICLLVIYYIWDSIAYRKESKEDIRRDDTFEVPLRISGSINLVWILGVILAVALIDPTKPIPGLDWTPFVFCREGIMLLLVSLSLLTTPRGVRAYNEFNYFAIIEVAALFAGIFIAMQVPLAVLNAYGSELGLDSPMQFFWATGILSSFLDNAPTYVVFMETAISIESIKLAEMAAAQGTTVAELLASMPKEEVALLLDETTNQKSLSLNGDNFIDTALLVGISLGAVFMGANTYIGNGPNFMVKSIAEQSGVKMPSFFGYMAYSTLILVPIFIVITLLFL